MVECAHGNRQFEGRSKDERIDVETRLIGLIKKYATQGYTISFELKFASLLPSAKQQGLEIVSPYAFCCYFCLMALRSWANRTGYNGKIAYFSESGRASHAEANRIMNAIFTEPTLREFYRYGAHAFVDKKLVRPLQCADLLAWQWRKYRKDLLQGKEKARGDLLSLLKAPEHFSHHFDEKLIRELRHSVAISQEGYLQ